MHGLYNAHFIRDQFHRECESCFAREALRLFNRARRKGRMHRIIGWLLHRCQHLLALPAGVQVHVSDSRLSRGVRSVSLDQIQGSENRNRDFDRVFHPLRAHVRDRWLEVASARVRGKVLPPVELIRVGNIYFVRDGHHRISVARALGEIFIDADVIG